MKRIFISHSSRDAETAKKLCDSLEKNGCPCWIAPRDISYGEKWAEKIADSLINQTMLFVFILSENSNQSKQVLKEINIAVSYDIPMLILGIQQVEKMNLSLIYYLTNLHIYECFSENETPGIEKMTDIVLRKVNGEKSPAKQESSDPAVPKKKEKNKKRIVTRNLEEELNEKFHELFGPGKENPPEPSEIRSRLYSIIGRNLVDYWSEFDYPSSCDDAEEIIPPVRASENADKDIIDPFHEPIAGKIFELHEREDEMTMVFQIDPVFDPQSCEFGYRARQLDSAVEILEDKSICHTFYVNDPQADGNPLVIITFINSKSLAAINMGFLDHDWVKISKSPKVMSVEKKSRCYEADEIYRYYAEKDSAYIVIDPENYSLVQPYTAYNEETERDETYIDIKAGKKYMAFNIQSNNSGSSEKHSSRKDALRIGYGYYVGTYGLEKNWMKAAEWFMQSDNPKAAYYLGVIFLKDPLLCEAGLAREYLESAAEKGIVYAEKLLTSMDEQA